MGLKEDLQAEKFDDEMTRIGGVPLSLGGKRRALADQEFDSRMDRIAMNNPRSAPSGPGFFEEAFAPFFPLPRWAHLLFGIAGAVAGAVIATPYDLAVGGAVFGFLIGAAINAVIAGIIRIGLFCAAVFGLWKLFEHFSK